MKSRGGRHTGDKPGEITWTALLACVIAGLLASSVAVASVVKNIDISPRVGDILVFHPNDHMATDWQMTAAFSAQPDASCVLNPALMASGGGSLVVEERLRKPARYRVHWAGVPTSAGAANCGRSADLIVPLLDLQVLSNAVGGPGVEH